MSANPNEELSLLGSSPSFVAVLEQVSRAAPLNRPVLVIGERGTGKELVAARLHYLSKRWDRPFVKLNCAALAETLLETELFGHEAGSFTGATRRHLGRFEMAHEGSLFLDEVANCSRDTRLDTHESEFSDTRLDTHESEFSDTSLVSFLNDGRQGQGDDCSHDLPPQPARPARIARYFPLRLALRASSVFVRGR